MPEPLKNLFSKSFINELSIVLSETIRGFNKKAFVQKIFDKSWEEKELKQRMRHITLTLHEFLPDDFVAASKIIVDITNNYIQKKGEGLSFLHMFLPEYIELFGINHFKESVKAFEQVTKFTSAEFAVRPFIIKYPEKMMAQMFLWSKNKNVYVRRLSTEGCRPRLPWAIALPEFKKNPALILPILENLKNDDAETVRKSVANNINDISKDNPDIVLNIIKKWKGKSKNTDWIIKHGARTLLKSGHEHAMSNFGLQQVNEIEISKFKLSSASIHLGETLSFTFHIVNKEPKDHKLRIDYAIYYVKSGGKQSKKVFRLTENNFLKQKVVVITKKQRFIDFTTRKHHAGKHHLSIIVNGKELAKKSFLLTR